jgi:hypothetical protein
MKLLRFYCVVLCGVLMPLVAFADRCPYCGREYGAAAPGDESRVYALRREHERTCPQRPRGTEQRGQEGTTAYGVVTIYNKTQTPIKYQLRRTRSGDWESATVDAGGWYYHWQSLPARFEIRYDKSFAEGYQAHSETLAYNVVSGRKPEHTDGCAYVLQSSDGQEIGLAGSYGVVTIYNRTQKPISYQIKRKQDGSWEKITLRSDHHYWHWQTLPADFQIRFDSSDAWGFQSKTYQLDHNTVTAAKPTAADGRAYEFVRSGKNLDVAEYKKVSLPGFDVSVMGNGTGDANGPFGEATRASGTYEISFMTRADRMQREGTWTAKRIKGGTGLVAITEQWRFVFTDKGKKIEAEATITGGAGTAETVWPNVPESGELKIRFGIQFSGSNVRLLSFTKAF